MTQWWRRVMTVRESTTIESRSNREQEMRILTRGFSPLNMFLVGHDATAKHPKGKTWKNDEIVWCHQISRQKLCSLRGKDCSKKINSIRVGRSPSHFCGWCFYLCLYLLSYCFCSSIIGRGEITGLYTWYSRFLLRRIDNTVCPTVYWRQSWENAFIQPKLYLICGVNGREGHHFHNGQTRIGFVSSANLYCSE